MKIEIIVQHGLDRTAVRRRVEDAIANDPRAKKLGLEIDWKKDFAAKLTSTGFKGALMIAQDSVTVRGKLSPIAVPLAARIKKGVGAMLKDSLFSE
jgi:hypothetical protein